ncbi:hypothetical protein Q8C87_004435 [Salmonella enterica]|nr:hypothetical protein [Salmonella enterica]EKQ5052256.1 hypothetical protein [Salmonella enterica]ELI2672418.1 hypothetical protein [Salmonella enterica]
MYSVQEVTSLLTDAIESVLSNDYQHVNDDDRFLSCDFNVYQGSPESDCFDIRSGISASYITLNLNYPIGSDRDNRTFATLREVTAAANWLVSIAVSYNHEHS